MILILEDGGEPGGGVGLGGVTPVNIAISGVIRWAKRAQPHRIPARKACSRNGAWTLDKVF